MSDYVTELHRIERAQLTLGAGLQHSNMDPIRPKARLRDTLASVDSLRVARHAKVIQLPTADDIHLWGPGMLTGIEQGVTRRQHDQGHGAVANLSHDVRVCCDVAAQEAVRAKHGSVHFK